MISVSVLGTPVDFNSGSYPHEIDITVPEGGGTVVLAYANVNTGAMPTPSMDGGVGAPDQYDYSIPEFGLNHTAGAVWDSVAEGSYTITISTGAGTFTAGRAVALLVTGADLAGAADTPVTGAVNNGADTGTLAIPSESGDVVLMITFAEGTTVSADGTPLNNAQIDTTGDYFLVQEMAGDTTVDIGAVYGAAGYHSWVAINFNAAAASSIELVVADSTHGHTADAPTLSQSFDLTVSEASHGQSVDGLALVQAHLLAVGEALHGHAADGPTLSTTLALSVDDETHAQTADQPSLTTELVLTVADSDHAQAADAPTLSIAFALSVDDEVHAQTADEPGLTQAHLLEVDEAGHAHAADAPTLGLAVSIEPADSSHGQTADSVELTQANTLAVAEALHAHLVDQPELALSTPLEPADSTHGHAVDAVDLTQGSVLAVAQALHAHEVDGVDLALGSLLSVAQALHSQSADAVDLVLGAPTVSGVAAAEITPFLAYALASTDTPYAGTGYAIASTSATPPTVEQIQAGQDSSGSAAAAANSGTPSNSIFLALDGLAAETAYYIYVQHRVGGFDSDVVASDQFTTGDPDPTGVATSETTATGTIDPDFNDGVLYWVVTESATQPTIEQVQAGDDHTDADAVDDGSETISVNAVVTVEATGLSGGTAHWFHYQYTGPEGGESPVVSSASFTTPTDSGPLLTEIIALPIEQWIMEAD